MKIKIKEKMIEEAVEKKIKKHEKDKKYKIKNMPTKQRHKLFLELLDKDKDLCMDIIYNRIKIPFYMMTKDEFTKVIKFF